MKYLITGGCGFLGSNIASALLKNNKEVTIFDNLSRFGSAQNLDWLKNQGKIFFCHGDIRDIFAVERCIRDFMPDVIYHLAGQVAMTTSIAAPRLDFEINSLGTLNVLEAVRKNAPECSIIYSSTNKVYGDLEWINYKENETRYVASEYPNGFGEETPLDFHSPYGCSKGAADQYLLDYARIYNLKTVVFRHSSMYGGRQFATYDQGWVGWFCQKAVEIKKGLLKEPFTISGNGKQVRDVLYADDMVRLYLDTATQIEKIKGKAYNIGGGMLNSLSLLELFEILEQELNVYMNYTKLPVRVSDQKIFVANNSKINDAIGWKPLYDKKIGIQNMISWVMKHT